MAMAVGNASITLLWRKCYLYMVVEAHHQDDWDERLPHAELAYNNSVSATTGRALAPNEAKHIDRLPRLPRTVLERVHGDSLHANASIMTNLPVVILRRVSCHQ